MTNIEELGGSGEDLTVADIVGDSFETPMELADSMFEVDIRIHITKLMQAQADIDVEIAKLEAKKQRLRAHGLIAQEALRIAQDRGLE